MSYLLISKAVKALLIRTAGTNCDAETSYALSLSGAKVKILHMRELLKNPKKILHYPICVIPGGFSYGDDISAGKIFANELKFRLGDVLQEFVNRRRLLIGICNGFQVLVKTGFLPGLDESAALEQKVSLARNSSGKFQCEWVKIKKEKSKAHWLEELPENFELPIAHGEGRFVVKTQKILEELEKNHQVVFRYITNPNGSVHSIAGICNPAGNVIGMMPHPERFISHFQQPSWTRTQFRQPTPGFLFWKCAIKQAR